MSATKVIYADSLLLVNFSMDFLALYIMVKLLSGVVYPIKMALAATIGAVWALIALLLESYAASPFFQIAMIGADIACAAVMVAVAVGERTVSLRRTLVFLAVNVGLGGIMTALYAFIGRIVGTENSAATIGESDSSAMLFIIAALIAGAVSLAYGKFRTRSISRKKVSMTLAAFGKESTIEVLCDSGNLLCEPFSGKPVVILSAQCMEGVLPSELIAAANYPELIVNLPKELSCGIRLIPTSSVAGKGMLLCFVPERMGVEGITIDAVAAIDPHSADYGGCDGIIPQILLSV